VNASERPTKPGWYQVQPVIQGEPLSPIACEVKAQGSTLRFAPAALPHEWREVASKEFDAWLWFGPFASRSTAFVPPGPGEEDPRPSE
jgi:hypothetical protein